MNDEPKDERTVQWSDLNRAGKRDALKRLGGRADRKTVFGTWRDRGRPGR